MTKPGNNWKWDSQTGSGTGKLDFLIYLEEEISILTAILCILILGSLQWSSRLNYGSDLLLQTGKVQYQYNY